MSKEAGYNVISNAVRNLLFRHLHRKRISPSGRNGSDNEGRRAAGANRPLLRLPLLFLAGLLACGPACWAGIAAYQLDGGTSVPASIGYWLSGNATSVTIDIIDATTSAVVYTFPTITGANASKGFHEHVVTWNGQANSGGTVPLGSYKVKSSVVAPGSGSVTNRMVPIWESVKADGTSNGWRIYGIALNNNPNSRFYGRVYVGNYQNDDGKTKAVWELDPDGNIDTARTLPIPAGGFGTSAPWGLCVDADDHVYVSNRSNDGAGPGVWRYSWDPNANQWVCGPRIQTMWNDRYLSCSSESGDALKLIDSYADPTGSPCISRLYAATGDPPGSFTQVGGDKTGVGPLPPYAAYISDRFYQAAIDANGTVLMSGVNLTSGDPNPAKGTLTQWNMAGGPVNDPTTGKNRNANLTQISGVALTPDGQTLWLARPVGPDGGSPSPCADPDDGSSGLAADKCIYKLPKSEAMTAVAYPTPSPNLTKYGLQTAYTGGGMKMPRFIAADGSRNLAIAGTDHFVDSYASFFGLYAQPTGATPTNEVRIGRNTITWGGDYSPEFVSALAAPNPVACGGSVVVSVTARDQDSVPGGENDSDSCVLFCPDLGIGEPGQPESGADMNLLSGPDAQKQNTYSHTIPVPANAPTGPVTAGIYLYDVHSSVERGCGAVTITVTGGVITGVITEGSTGSPAAQVTIRATKGSFYREAITDSAGAYTINVTPDTGYTVAPLTNTCANTIPTEYNLQSDWPNDPGSTDWPKTVNVTLGGSATVNGRVWPLAITQATYDWSAHAYRTGGRTVCVTGTVLRQAADSTVAPNRKGYNGYHFIADMLGGAYHDTQQAVKVKVFSKGSECKRGDKVVVVGTFSPPANYSAGVITLTASPIVLSGNNALPAPRDATAFTDATLYGNVIGGWYVMKNKTVTRVGSQEFYVQVPNSAGSPPTVEFRIDLDTASTTGLAMPTVGQVMDIYGVLDELAAWNTLRALRPGEPGDAGLQGLAPDIPTAKTRADNTDVGLLGAQVTRVAGGIPDDIAYIQQPDRTSALRIHCPGMAPDVGPGDLVVVQGKMATTPQGERFIEATTFNRVTLDASKRPIDAIGMNNRDAASAKALGLYIKTWGKVTEVETDYFTISDGSPVPIEALCGPLEKPELDEVVRVRGIASRDASGPVLLVRNERVEWAYGSETYQPLPLPGAYKYPRDFLVIGPFADANSVPPAPPGNPIPAQTYRLDRDFIRDATAGAYGELDMMSHPPSPGGTVGTKTWQRSQSVGDNASFTTVFPTASTYCTFYAHIWLYSPIEQWVAMRVGSDDSVKVILSGVEVWRNLVNNPGASPPTTGRVETQGEDLSGGVTIYPGFNSLLFKVEQGTGAAGVDCQFVSPYAPGAPGWGGATPYPGLGYLLSYTE